MKTLKLVRFKFENFDRAIVELPSGTYIIYDDYTIIMGDSHIEEFKELLEDLNYSIV